MFSLLTEHADNDQQQNNNGNRDQNFQKILDPKTFFSAVLAGAVYGSGITAGSFWGTDVFRNIGFCWH